MKIRPEALALVATMEGRRPMADRIRAALDLQEQATKMRESANRELIGVIADAFGKAMAELATPTRVVPAPDGSVFVFFALGTPAPVRKRGRTANPGALVVLDGRRPLAERLHECARTAAGGQTDAANSELAAIFESAIGPEAARAIGQIEASFEQAYVRLLA